MIDWIVELSVAEKIGFFGVIFTAIGVLIAAVSLFGKQKTSQNIQGNAEKVAQVIGDNAKIDIK
jgi:hypothetical protein